MLTVAAMAGVFSLPAAASAATAHPDGCAPDTYVVVSTVGGPSYSSTGSAAGKYNGGTAASTLALALATTTQRATNWEVSGGATVGWGILQVEAKYSYNITTTTIKLRTVTDTLQVPGHYYGYAQPKVEYRNFSIEEHQTTPQCGDSTIADYGILHAITADPFFSECTATAACTPKP
jgi:hypothetical protein